MREKEEGRISNIKYLFFLPNPFWFGPRELFKIINQLAENLPEMTVRETFFVAKWAF